MSLVTASGKHDDNGYKHENIVLIPTRSRSNLRFFVIFENMEYIIRDKQENIREEGSRFKIFGEVFCQTTILAYNIYICNYQVSSTPQLVYVYLDFFCEEPA